MKQSSDAAGAADADSEAIERSSQEEDVRGEGEEEEGWYTEAGDAKESNTSQGAFSATPPPARPPGLS